MTIVKASRIFVLVGISILLSTIVSAQGGPSEAPLPPPNNVPDMPEGRGFIPPTIDLGHLTPKKPSPSMALSLPTDWDWRAQGAVTAVRNQGSCGSCYSFAAAANFEAKVLVDGGSTFDFSENNIKECNYWDASCDGGNYHMVADLLSKTGTVLESCDGYVAANVACNSSCEYQKTLLDWRIISSATIPSATSLKQYIYDNGPVYTTVYSGDANDASWLSEFNGYNGSYTMYYAGSHTNNHAVLIVGWDDALACVDTVTLVDTLTHDTVTWVDTLATGGWIVRNSWGTSWGGTCGYGAESGYFTIAYGSAGIGQYSSYVNEYQDYASNGELLYLDDGGWTTSYGYGITTAYGLTKHTLPSDQYVTRIEFWTNDVTTDVDVWLYDDFNGSTVSNLLASKTDTSFTEAGYHSIALPSPPQVSSGEDVYAVVKFTNSSYGYPVVSDDTSPVAASTSYLSSSGTSGSWIDLGGGYGSEIGIRIRTNPTLSLGIDDTQSPVPEDFELGYNYPNPFNPATTISYFLEEKAVVEITVFNVLGQKARTLVSTEQSVGEHSVVWDGRTDADIEAGTGIYFYRIQVGDQSQVKKMLLLR